jgi:uncharacterized protein with HEPN domain
MPDEIMNNLRLIIKSIDLVNARFLRISHPDDLVSSESGVIILDAIAMRLQVIGELLKKINKKDHSFLNGYPEIEWNNIMRLRDIVSHHYETVDHQIIFDMCKNHLPKSQSTIQKMLE